MHCNNDSFRKRATIHYKKMQLRQKFKKNSLCVAVRWAEQLLEMKFSRSFFFRAIFSLGEPLSGWQLMAWKIVEMSFSKKSSGQIFLQESPSLGGSQPGWGAWRVHCVGDQPPSQCEHPICATLHFTNDFCALLYTALIFQRHTSAHIHNYT